MNKDYLYTAYVLGEELSSEDRAWVEQRFANDPELKAQYEVQLEFTEELEAAYSEEVDHFIESSAEEKVIRFPAYRKWLYGGMAACMVGAFLIVGSNALLIRDEAIDMMNPEVKPFEFNTPRARPLEVQDGGKTTMPEPSDLPSGIKKGFDDRSTFQNESSALKSIDEEKLMPLNVDTNALAERESEISEKVANPSAEGVDTIYELSPFVPEGIAPPEVAQPTSKMEYDATQTLAGTRLHTSLRSEIESELMGSGAVSSNRIVTPKLTERQNVQPKIIHSSDGESYDNFEFAKFQNPKVSPLSTFSIDVDTASYSNIRRYVQGGLLPPKSAVRIEEMLNYFDYSDPAPESGAEHPFKITMETGLCPWSEESQLLRIGIKAEELDWENRPASNFVFLIDTSGSMQDWNKLDFVKASLKNLVLQLDERDRVAVVTYAGSSDVALPSTTADNGETIMHAIDRLGAGGSTYGAAGIRTAYEIAAKHFIEGGNNRVILCTDGDFNVGITSKLDLVDWIETNAKKGIELTILGYGAGNLNDDLMEHLSNKGNGNYAYIDSLHEARRVLVEEASGTLYSIARDVKIQVEFNPEQVSAYRLVGYENRALAAEDFNNDKVDAGEVGAGHHITVLYEIITGEVVESLDVDPLKYQSSEPVDSAADEWLNFKLRYKPMGSDTSLLIESPYAEPDFKPTVISEDMLFASVVAAFGEYLRGSEFGNRVDLKKIIGLGSDAIAGESDEKQAELLELIRRVQTISRS